jgi:hypothetical protein
MMKKEITLKVGKKDQTLAYLYLPNHPKTPGCVVKQILLKKLIDDYSGPVIYLDFAKDGELIGIEIDASESD